MFKKIIGLALLVLLVIFTIKAVKLLPYFSNAIIGPNKSPYQVGTSYVDQVQKQIDATYPYQYTKIRYGNAKYYTNTDNAKQYIGRVTLEKINGNLNLTIENAQTPTRLNAWLINTETINDQTEYVDFGIVQNSNSIKNYSIDMQGGDISLDEFKTIVFVDSQNQIYATINLQ